MRFASLSSSVGELTSLLRQLRIAGGGELALEVHEDEERDTADGRRHEHLPHEAPAAEEVLV